MGEPGGQIAEPGPYFRITNVAAEIDFIKFAASTAFPYLGTQYLSSVRYESNCKMVGGLSGSHD